MGSVVVELTVFAAPEVAGSLAQAALVRSINAGDTGERDKRLLADHMAFPRLVQSAVFLKHDLDRYGIDGGDPELRLQSHLRKAVTQAYWDNIQKALAAGEIIATLERRPVERQANWTAHDADMVDTLEGWAAQQDTVAVETVELALRTVTAITPEQATDPTILTAERRRSTHDNWRRWLGDLVHRLEAAVRSRRVRAKSANAPPPVLTKKTLDQLASPERWTAFHFYALRDDALALLDFLRDETGASVYSTMSHGDIQERASSWDCRQVLSEAFDGHFDDRRIVDFREKTGGIKFQIWWPGVSPPPVVRERPAEEADPEGDAMLRELGVEPPTKQPLEVVGWGIAGALFLGASVEQVTRGSVTSDERLLLQSAFEYPTGNELKRARYQGHGPWREVNWKELRRKVRAVRTQLKGPLAHPTAVGRKGEPVLRLAGERLPEGWELADDGGHRPWKKPS